MPTLQQSHSQIVRLSRELHHLADGFQLDGNASRFLVHETLMTAFAMPADARSQADRERDLRRDMAGRLRALSNAPGAAAMA